MSMFICYESIEYDRFEAFSMFSPLRPSSRISSDASLARLPDRNCTSLAFSDGQIRSL